MKHHQRPTVIFLRVTDIKTKLNRITSTVQKYFQQGDKIMINAHSEYAATHLDQLLWRIPQAGFLPHTKTTKSCSDPVVITTSKENLNGANIVVNLCPTPIENDKQYEVIYELFDQTLSSKEALSKQKIQLYQKMGLNPDIV